MLHAQLLRVECYIQGQVICVELIQDTISLASLVILVPDIRSDTGYHNGGGLTLSATKGGPAITLTGGATGKSHSIVKQGNLPSGDASETGMRDISAWMLRYELQTYGYLFLLTGRYPSLSGAPTA